MEAAVAVPQEPLPALCCIPEPQVLLTEPSGRSFWRGIEMAFGFSYTPLPVFCECAPPQSPQVPLGVLEASEHIHCTLKFSFCLLLHPGALPRPSSTSGNSVSLSVSPEPSKHLSLLPGSLHRCF